MKVVTPKLTAVCLITFVAAIAAQAVEKYDDGMDVLEFFSHLRNGYSGYVTAVERPARGDALVRIRATTEYVYPKEPLADRKERKVSKECVLRWTNSDQPVPLIVGMGVAFTAQDDGDVTAAMLGETMVPYYRKNADGLIEVLLHWEVSAGKKVWLRARPDRINLIPYATVAWSRQHGLVISMFDAGGGDTEEESPGARTKGLPVSNVPGERIQIGRDGWKKTPPDLYHEKSKGVVPPKQFISAAG